MAETAVFEEFGEQVEGKPAAGTIKKGAFLCFLNGMISCFLLYVMPAAAKLSCINKFLLEYKN
jgi:hypothetical protein